MFASLARWGVRLIDYLLRKSLGVREFSDAEGCMLRIAPSRAKKRVALSDGTVVNPGDFVCEIHMWNERVPKMGPGGPDVQWALATYKGVLRSLELLADYLPNHPPYSQAVAVHGEGTVMRGLPLEQALRIWSRVGFDTMPKHAQTRLERFGRWWQNLYTSWLMWTFNAVSLREKRITEMTHCEFWISRRAFMERYGCR